MTSGALHRPAEAARRAPVGGRPPIDPRDPSATAAARRAVTALWGPPSERSFAVRYWDGSVEGSGAGESRFTLVVRRPGALRRALLPPSELALVEAYLRDDLDIEGDMQAAGTLGDLAARRLRSAGDVGRLARTLLRLPRDEAPDDLADARHSPGPLARLLRHTRGEDAASVRHHYDVGNEFYSLWLDARMVYSCAYFPTGAESLDAAQEAKLEHVCRKLRLRAGHHLLDVGCGWGGLLEFAATRYGVTGVGITLSEPQALAARARLQAAGVGDRVRIEVRDYRDLPGDWTFDRAVSVGMREHVGARRLPGFFAAVHRALRPGGLYLDHGIVRGGAVPAGPRVWLARRLWRRDAFIQRYVFPGGELVPLGAIIRDAERAGLEARDVENLREHYGRTLDHWVSRLEARHAEAAAIVGERTYRVWRLYMAATGLGFASGRITLIQSLFAKPGEGGGVEVPRTRADLYAPAGAHRA